MFRSRGVHLRWSLDPRVPLRLLRRLPTPRRRCRQGHVCCFPEPDGSDLMPQLVFRVPPLWPLRPWLRETWARAGRMFTRQPIHQVQPVVRGITVCWTVLFQIRAYFGEKVGLYFAWLGFYNQMLMPLALLGLAVFAFGLTTFQWDPAVRDVCRGNLSQEFICRLVEGLIYAISFIITKYIPEAATTNYVTLASSQRPVHRPK